MMSEKIENPVKPRRGRPRNFDRELALTRALDIFWLKGYEPASIQELCVAMEINPPSLYAAFGNKAQLFLESMRYYETKYWDHIWEKMVREPDLYKAVNDFFLQAAKILTAPDLPCGCMVVLAAINVSANSQEVLNEVKKLRQEGRDCFLARLEQGIQTGQLPVGTDVEVLAYTFNTLLEGMSIQARDGLSQTALEGIGRAAMAILPKL